MYTEYLTRFVNCGIVLCSMVKTDHGHAHIAHLTTITHDSRKGVGDKRRTPEGVKSFSRHT